jgi:hypothetical protein
VTEGVADSERVSDESHKDAIQHLQDVLDREEIPSLAMLRLEAPDVPRLVHHLASCNSVAEANLCCIVPKSALPFLRRHYGSLVLPESMKASLLECHRSPLTTETCVLLHHTPKSEEITFQFHGTLAGVPCSVLWDTCAFHNFISKSFADTHGLTIKDNQSDKVMEIANGQLLTAFGTIRAKLHVQGYSQEITFHGQVLNTGPGIDVILGDRWSHQERVVSDYGVDPPTYEPPSLWLAKRRIHLIPNKPSSSSANMAKTTACMLLPTKAMAKVLRNPNSNVSPPLLLLVRTSNRSSSFIAFTRLRLL